MNGILLSVLTAAHEKITGKETKCMQQSRTVKLQWQAWANDTPILYQPAKPQL